MAIGALPAITSSRLRIGLPQLNTHPETANVRPECAGSGASREPRSSGAHGGWRPFDESIQGRPEPVFMKILAFHNYASHDAGAAVLSDDGDTLRSITISDERLSRVKYSYFFPVRALDYCMSHLGIGSPASST